MSFISSADWEVWYDAPYLSDGNADAGVRTHVRHR